MCISVLQKTDILQSKFLNSHIYTKKLCQEKNKNKKTKSKIKQKKKEENE